MAFARGLGTVLSSRDAPSVWSAPSFPTTSSACCPSRPPSAAPSSPPTGAGAAAAVVLSWQLWQRRFAGDRSVVGRNVTLGDRAYTVVGVMPAGLPIPPGPTSGRRSPPSSPPTPRSASGACTSTAGSSPGSARGWTRPPGQRALSAVAARMAGPTGGKRRLARVALIPVASEVLGDTGPQLRLLTAAAAFVLLIACVNVAGLALARAGGRSRELAIRMRSAAGARRCSGCWPPNPSCSARGRRCWARAGAAGGSLGQGRGPRAAAADGRGRGGSRHAPRRRRGRDRRRRRAGTPAGAPAVGPARGGPAGGRGRVGRTGPPPPSGALVVGEIALALVLLTGRGPSSPEPGATAAGTRRARRRPPARGADRAALARYDAPERALQLYRDVAAAVAAVPGVGSVALTNYVPLSGASINTAIEVDGGRPRRRPTRSCSARWTRPTSAPRASPSCAGATSRPRRSRTPAPPRWSIRRWPPATGPGAIRSASGYRLQVGPGACRLRRAGHGPRSSASPATSATSRSTPTSRPRSTSRTRSPSGRGCRCCRSPRRPGGRSCRRSRAPSGGGSRPAAGGRAPGLPGVSA